MSDKFHDNSSITINELNFKLVSNSIHVLLKHFCGGTLY